MDKELSDECLMLNYAKGDAAAFELLYRKHKGPVYRYMFRLCHNEAIAEELFQELWMKLIKARGNYIASAKFTTYLYKMAHHLFIDHYRKQNVRIIEDSLIDVDEIKTAGGSINDPENQLHSSRSLDKITEILATLPREQREVFLLREETGMTVTEIAGVVGINNEAVKSRLRYAIAKLRAGLSDE
jgi:RNA polymerase sigma-70 factor (ECF subfamily)